MALAELVPTAVDMKAFEELERLDRVGLRAKLDALAANRMAHNPDFYAHAWGSKLLTQLFQAALRNETHLEMLLGDVGSGEKVALGLDDALAHLPLRELRPFVAERLAAFAKLDASKARKLWQRNRKAIESAYTVDSLLRTLIYFLESKEPLPPIFNLHALAKNWPAIEARIGKVQLPEPLPNLELAIQRHMPKNVIVARMFQPIVERLLAKADLPTSRTAIYVAALQVEAALGDKVPGTGNVFDAERAIALHEVDVFHTTDVRLVAQAKQARNRFGLDVEVTDSEKELRRVIAARMRTR